MVDSLSNIKELRELTSCGVIDCKKALEEASGDINKAKEILRKRGLELAAKKSSRTAKEGRIETYVHMGNKIAVIVEVNCETDFVARNEDFCKFSKDIAMHIAAMNPKYISEKEISTEDMGKIKEQKQFFKENCLMSQAFVKDQQKSVQEYLNEIIAKIGENIFISRYVRYKVGEVE